MRAKWLQFVLTVAVLVTFLKVLLREQGSFGEKLIYILRALVGDQVDQRPYYTHDGSQRKYEEPRYAVAF
jgi:hypothetical protein